MSNNGNAIARTLFRVDNNDNSHSVFDPPAGEHTAILAHIDNTGGTPTTGIFYGLFSQANAPGSGASAIGVYGLAGTVANPDGTGVVGIGGTIGVNGSGNIGVRGTGSIGGVEGICDGNSNRTSGVRGEHQGPGVGGAFFGVRAAVSLEAGRSPVANPNIPLYQGSAGDLYRGTNGSLWYRASGTNPYRRLADSTTAGALSLLAAPLRLVDTRNGSGFFDAGNHYSNGTTRNYPIVSLSGGAVPPGTRAIVARATALNSTVGGVIRESPVNPPGTGSAIINFDAGQVVGATFISALNSSGQIFVQAAIGGGTVDVILDVTGYYL